MESLEVFKNGGYSNGEFFVSESYGDSLKQVNGENELEDYMIGDGNGKGNFAEEVLLDGLEEYWEDINDRLRISRIVSDSLIKGMVSAVEQEAADRIASKELEVAALRERIKSNEVGGSEFEGRSYGRFSCFADEKIREDLYGLRNVAIEQFEKAKKEVECVRGRKSVNRIGSGSELAGLGGILEEKKSDSLVHVDKMLECMKITMDTVCAKVDGIIQASKVSPFELQEERELSSKLEGIVMESVLRSCQEEFEEKLWEQNVKSCGIDNMNWIEKLNDISSLGTKLDAVLKSLSIPEGLVSHGSLDMDQLHQKASSNHATTAASENGTLEASRTAITETYDYQQLKHMTKEDLVSYFNNIITRLSRDHESSIQQKTEEYFRLKREYLKEMGSLVKRRKDEEHDVLRKKIPEVITKLDNFLLENKICPALTNNVESMGKMKDRIENLLAENRQLRDCLADMKNEVRCLEAQVSGTPTKSIQQHSPDEKKMLKLVENLELAVEDTCIKASIAEEVYKCTLRELIEHRHASEDSDMEFLSNRYDIDDSDVHTLIMQGLIEIIFTEAIKDAEVKLEDMYQDVLAEKEIRKCIEKEALEKEKELKQEVEEKEKLHQEILDLEAAMEQKEKELSVTLSKEKKQFEIVSQELSSLREQASQQHTKWSREFELLTAQLREALEQIEVDKSEMYKLNQRLDQRNVELAEVKNDRNIALDRAQKMHDKFLLCEAREEEVKKEMETAMDNVHGLLKMFDNFECKITWAIGRNNSTLEDTSSHLKDLTEMANELKLSEVMYRQNIARKCADLEMAEAEVDLLGDEVDALLRLLERIYIALDHYSPVLKHYTGIVEILELVRRELTGESTKIV